MHVEHTPILVFNGVHKAPKGCSLCTLGVVHGCLVVLVVLVLVFLGLLVLVLGLCILCTNCVTGPH